MTKLACGQDSISAESEAFSECGWSSEEAGDQTQQEGSEETGLKEMMEVAPGPAIEDPGQMAERLICDHKLPAICG